MFITNNGTLGDLHLLYFFNNKNGVVIIDHPKDNSVAKLKEIMGTHGDNCLVIEANDYDQLSLKAIVDKEVDKAKEDCKFIHVIIDAGDASMTTCAKIIELVNGYNIVDKVFIVAKGE